MRYFLFKLAVKAAKRLCTWGYAYDYLNLALVQEKIYGEHYD